MRRTAVFLLFLLASCGKLELPTSPTPGGGGEPIDSSATFTRVQSEIFTPSCAQVGCHDRIGQQQGLVLASGAAYGNTVNRASTEMPQLMRILPGDPANSYLYRKVTGSGISGGRMPLGQASLSDAQLKLMRDWIRRGAPND